jgi:molecular chaperone GrpE
MPTENKISEPTAQESITTESAGQTQQPPEANVEDIGHIGILESQLEEANAALAKAQAEVVQFKDEYLRARAEAENIRRRSAEDVLKANKYGVEKFARDILSVCDSLDAALAIKDVTIDTLKSGADITYKQLSGVLERFGVTEVSGADEKFDPNIHQAIAQVPSDQAANTVVAVMQKGYKLHDRCLRPAMVTVSSGPATVN